MSVLGICSIRSVAGFSCTVWLEVNMDRWLLGQEEQTVFFQPWRQRPVTHYIYCITLWPALLAVVVAHPPALNTFIHYCRSYTQTQVAITECTLPTDQWLHKALLRKQSHRDCRKQTETFYCFRKLTLRICSNCSEPNIHKNSYLQMQKFKKLCFAFALGRNQ